MNGNNILSFLLPFSGLILQMDSGHLFLIVIVNLTWTQMFLRKLQFAAKYWYNAIMLRGV